MQNCGECKKRVRDSLQRVESCTTDERTVGFDAFVRDYETSIYKELGRITRQLHDALTSFQADEKISSLMKGEIPGAKERLEYVMTITEQAAQKVLEFVEMSVPLSLQIKEGASELSSSTLERYKDINKMRAVEGNTRKLLIDAAANADTLHGDFTERLMAQESQDSSGQILKKAIDLVQKVQNNLLRIINIAGSADSVRRVARNNVEAGGPCIAGLGGRLVRGGAG
jgi:chemotaxis protein CheZ